MRPPDFLADVPFAAFLPGDFRAEVFFGPAFLAPAFFAVFFVVFFVALFFAAVFLVVFPVLFFAPVFFGALFLPAAFFRAVFLPAVFFVAAFFAPDRPAVRFPADAFRAVFAPADAFLLAVLGADLPADRFAAVFDVAFFTLFFPTGFLVVLLAPRPALAELAVFLPPFPAALRPLPRDALFPAPARRRPDFAAGPRTVAMRARGAVTSSDCSACPAFDLACEAMLTSRNAGMGRLPGSFSSLVPLQHPGDVPQ